MNEKEKMMAGLPYDSRDAELIGRYKLARNYLLTLNNTSNIDDKEQTLKMLLGAVGNGAWIETPFMCDYGNNIKIGANTFINYNCVFIDDNLITIGENCLLGPNVQLYTSEHPIDAKSRIIDFKTHTRYITTTKPITIGDNVWIGGNVVILPGVTIGDNVTIGAGSVVTKSIPSDRLAVGNPAKVVREI